MLKHMASNGGIGTRLPRIESSLVMEPSRYRSGGSTSAVSPVSTSRMQQSFPLALNASALTASKHSLLSPKTLSLNGGLSLGSRPRAAPGLMATSLDKPNVSPPRSHKHIGIKEMLVSLGLLCLVSLLLALLSLIFLLKISPVTANDIRELLRAEQLTVITAEEYAVVYEVTLALCALTLSLNLCCLLVCAIQFLFAVKLVKSPHGGNDRTNKYLQKSSVSRVCAVGGFFISIPVFLTGIILYTFIQFHSTPAIVTSVFIGLGIIFCGCAMVHNVFIWQREKTNAVKELALQQHEQIVTTVVQQQQHNGIQLTSPTTGTANNTVSYNHSFMLPLHNSTATPYILRPATTTPPTADSTKAGVQHPREASGTGSVSPGMPTMPDLSSVATTNSPHELSTLV